MIFEARVAEMPLHWAVFIMFLRGEKLLNTNLIDGVSAFYVDPDAPEELEVDAMGP